MRSSTGITLIPGNSTAFRSLGRVPKPIVERANVDCTREGVEEESPGTVETPASVLKQYMLPEMASKLSGSYQLLQLWEGYVLSVEDGEMRCRIIDKSNDDNPPEDVCIPLKEIEPADLPLVVPGGVFYWSIRYADQLGRGRTRVSLIRFRRLPSMTKQQLDKSKERAQYLEEFFSTVK